MRSSASRLWTATPLIAVAAVLAVPAYAASAVTSPDSVWTVNAGRTPETSNLTDPATFWRLDPHATFNGVANAFDGTALLLFKVTTDNFTHACSGSLMQGGAYVLTAGHCVTNLKSMDVRFGWYNGTALETRSVTAVHAAPGWVDFNTNADQGNDLALVKLDAPVTNLHAYALSTTNDIGKTQLITGYGTTGTGGSSASPGWNDPSYGHFGYNTPDVTSQAFNEAAGNTIGPGWGYDAGYYLGTTYMSDFDNAANPDNNTLGRLATLTAGGWSSGNGVAGEALIAGGDSGGGDFVWDGSRWLLSAVHSWGWNNACLEFGLVGCDASKFNTSSFGDLSGSTAVFDHIAWIQSVTGVPEPSTNLLLLAGMLTIGAAARRAGARALARP